MFLKGKPLMKDKISEFFSDQYTKNIIIVTAVLNLITHAYKYFHIIYVHDCVFPSWDIHFRDAFGAARWFACFSGWFLGGGASVSWLSGVWATLFMIVVVFCVCKCLRIESVLGIIVTAGICVTNKTMIMSHIFPSSDFALAAAFASLGAMFASKSSVNKWCNYTISVFCGGLSAATYGSYFFLMPMLLMMTILLDIFDGKRIIENIKTGVRYSIICLFALAFWYIVEVIGIKITGTKLQEYMGENRILQGSAFLEIYKKIPEVYSLTIKDLFTEPINIFMIIFMFFLLIYLFALNRKMIKDMSRNCILTIFIIVLLPLVMNATYLMSGYVHYLMKYAYVGLHLLIILLLEKYLHNSERDKKLYGLGIVIILYINIVIYIYIGIMTANQYYSHLEKNYEASLSMATRLLGSIESYDDYNGTEKVIIVGEVNDSEYLNNKDTPGLKLLENMSIAPRDINHCFTYGNLLPLFMKNILGTNIDVRYYHDYNTYVSDLGESNVETITTMPCYPVKGSIQKIDDFVILKLSEFGYNQ